ncbi:MAG TPA: LamG-like jellyroll fold domain-containing protein, partial [Pyrinomonadaceae bacterium]
YRTSGSGDAVNPSGNWTETVYDGLGRVKTVTCRPDNSVLTTAYTGNQVTVTDQAGKTQRSVTDALGRLVQVIEDPNGLAYSTTYTYDVTGNLRKVTQGAQSRFFMYDSLSRLVRVKIPEQGDFAPDADFPTLVDPVTSNSQWSSGYKYDGNRNLVARKDARNVRTDYVYDPVNRNTTVRYQNDPAGTPGIDYHYDNGTNGRGRLWYDVTIGGTALTFGYDVAGRVTVQSQNFWNGGAWGSAFSVQRTYDLSGNVRTQTYPSGRTVNYSYDDAGRLSGFSGNLGGAQRNYSTALSYDPQGSIRQEQFGTDTPVYNKRFYNVRGQLSEIRVSTYSINTPGQETNWNRGALINHYSHQTWAGSGTDNNSLLRKQDVYIPNDDAISGYSLTTFFYNYDALSRLDNLTEAREGQNSFYQDYDYDSFGNRTINAANSWGGVPEPQFSVNAANNRLGVPAGSPAQMTYDAAGNLTVDTYTGQGTRTFDAENRMTAAQDTAGQTSTYAFDAEGRRVKRTTGGQQVWQVYGVANELLAEYAAGAAPAAPQKEYGYRSGELLITAESSAGGGESVWVDDSLPAGATPAPDTDGWNWVGSNPPPYSGSLSHQSSVVAGLHQHFFYNASQTLPVGAGEVLYTYVYLDPANPPSEVMLQWNDGSWEHRAFWGADQIGWGTAGTNSRRYMGALPAAGQWVRLEVPASQVGLEGATLNGMAFTLYGGRATWDKAGKAGGAPTSGLVAHWKLDEGTGATAGDSSGGGHTATLVGAGWGAGRVGPSAAALDGVDDYAQVGSANTLKMTGQMTASAWLYPTGAGSLATYGGIIVNREGEYELARFTDGTIQWAFANTNPGWNWVNTGAVAPLNQWTHVAVTYDQGVVKTYVNGVLAHTYAGAGAIGDVDASLNDFRVGGRQAISQNFAGRLDEVRVYNRALSASEVGAAAGAGGAASVQWLVSDQLGTPRMVLDATGSLAGVKRHDYLPFGEELFAGVGGRTPQQGYSAADGLRQKLTGYERDNETGLDYAQARYYASSQGRFTSP